MNKKKQINVTFVEGGEFDVAITDWINKKPYTSKSSVIFDLILNALNSNGYKFLDFEKIGKLPPAGGKRIGAGKKAKNERK
jgi:hypothetical protein